MEEFRIFVCSKHFWKYTYIIISGHKPINFQKISKDVSFCNGSYPVLTVPLTPIFQQKTKVAGKI